ncbi:sugar-binding transcriptional regulator [Leucobacter sp. BZR 635]
MAEERKAVKLREALAAAQLYYRQDFTMQAIAKELGVSRSSVSRLLSYAKESGLVEIRIHSPQEARSRVEQRFAERFGVTAHVVPVAGRLSENEQLERTAQVAAHLIAASVKARSIVGVAWGSTISAVTKYLPSTSKHGVQLVQMNGAANVYSTGVQYTTELLGGFAERLSAEVFQLPVPAIFDDPATREALWRERSVARVLDLQAAANLCVFGLGSRIGDPRSHIYSGGYLGSDDLSELASQGVVGDCASRFYRLDGSTAGIPINDRSSGPSFEAVRRAPQRICVVSGAMKRDSLRGALAAGLITDVVVDEALARLVLAAG